MADSPQASVDQVRQGQEEVAGRIELPRYAVSLTTRACADLDDIHAFIASDSPQNADRAIARLFERIDSLSTLPRRFPVAPDALAASGEVRHTAVYSYRIIYELVDNEVIVHAVRHGKRRPIRDRV